MVDTTLQRMHLSTDYGGYNMVRHEQEIHLTHYASFASTLQLIHTLMLHMAPNFEVDAIKKSIDQPESTHPWAAVAYNAYRAIRHLDALSPLATQRAHKVTPHPRPAVKPGRPPPPGTRSVQIPTPWTYTSAAANTCSCKSALP